MLCTNQSCAIDSGEFALLVFKYRIRAVAASGPGKGSCQLYFFVIFSASPQRRCGERKKRPQNPAGAPFSATWLGSRRPGSGGSNLHCLGAPRACRACQGLPPRVTGHVLGSCWVCQRMRTHSGHVITAGLVRSAISTLGG
jgi:hypothetical protein